MKTQIKKPADSLAVRVCRQCNQRFGPGPSHFSQCNEHDHESWDRHNTNYVAAQELNWQNKTGAL